MASNLGKTSPLRIHCTGCSFCPAFSCSPRYPGDLSDEAFARAVAGSPRARGRSVLRSAVAPGFAVRHYAGEVAWLTWLLDALGDVMCSTDGSFKLSQKPGAATSEAGPGQLTMARIQLLLIHDCHICHPPARTLLLTRNLGLVEHTWRFRRPTSLHSSIDN